MAIKAEFLTGQTEKRVSALYQWDYGQTLEIEAPGLSTLVEVHFACRNMEEAIVHVCSVTNGVAAVPIPDRCLEQSDLITAWVYEIEGSSGATTKVVYIPVIARTRPPRTHEIPQEVSDKYTELITEVNEAVRKITSGEVMVGSAARATSADRAAHADNASSAAHAEQATYATGAASAITASTAQNATYAGEAAQAIKDGGGEEIATKYVFMNKPYQLLTDTTLLLGGTYQFKVLINTTYCYAILPIDGSETRQVSLGWVGDSTHYVLVSSSTNGGRPVVSFYGNTSMGTYEDAVIYYRKIHDSY